MRKHATDVVPCNAMLCVYRVRKPGDKVHVVLATDRPCKQDVLRPYREMLASLQASVRLAMWTIFGCLMYTLHLPVLPTKMLVSISM